MISRFELDAIVDRALVEDAAAFDITTMATASPESRAVGHARAKADLVVCGADVFARVFYRVDPGVRVEVHCPDGALARPGDCLFEVEGAARSLLAAERTALNFAQRLSGIATLTKRFVDALPAGSHTRIVDTRKTTPGLRRLERYAVRCGGAHNHRDCLSSAVLIKDNHIVVAGGVVPALEKARRNAPHGSRLEIEVGNLEELDAALGAGAEVVLLDNFEPGELEQAVSRASGRALIEVSGGVTIDRIFALAELGVDVISVGALTHSAPAADISFDMSSLGSEPWQQT